jgi:sugar fermentation stimulation protein A
MEIQNTLRQSQAESVIPYRIADRWEEALFHERPNRFTLVLRSGKRLIKAYLPNTGRLEEYLVEGSRFYIVPFSSPKFSYRVASTLYQDHYVSLDTIQMNHVVASLIKQKRFIWLGEHSCIRQEKSMGRSRFDFCIERREKSPLMIEVKTCTLVHNGVAMFPDAPTPRALSHLSHMGRLSTQGYETLMLFMLPTGGARLFRPNMHTDPDFSDSLAKERHVSLRAVSITLIDPVTFDMDTLRELPVDLHVRAGEDRGSYMLVLYNCRLLSVEVGSLGNIDFKKGYYVYVGSALNSLKARLSRHRRSRKKRFWHIDYVTPEYFKQIKSYTIHRTDRIEGHMVDRVRSVAHASVRGFGCSDSSASSHLFYFQTPPFRNSRFMDIVLDFRTGTE